MAFEGLIKPCTNCMNPKMEFPPPTESGLPNLVLATLTAQFAGVNYVLDFIPPTPQKVTSLKPPSIDLFIKPFMASMKLPDTYPSTTISVGGLSIPFPGSGSSSSQNPPGMPPKPNGPGMPGAPTAGLPGAPVAPAVPGLGYDVSGQFKIMAVCIALPFLIIKAVITGLLNLSLVLPTIGGVTALFSSLCAEVGLAGAAIAKLGGCLAKSIIALVTSLI